MPFSFLANTDLICQTRSGQTEKPQHNNTTQLCVPFACRWVTAVCVLSVFILGLLTYAFEAVKVYRCELFTSHFVFSFLSFRLCSFHVSPEDAKGRFDKCISTIVVLLFVRVFFRRDPQLIEDVGVVDGRKFIRMYSLSFICCKIATVFFVLLGHIPEFSGKKSHIFCPFCTKKRIILSRQARDKHRENSKRDAFSYRLRFNAAHVRGLEGPGRQHRLHALLPCQHQSEQHDARRPVRRVQGRALRGLRLHDRLRYDLLQRRGDSTEGWAAGYPASDYSGCLRACAGAMAAVCGVLQQRGGAND